MAKALKIKRYLQFCSTYNAAYFEGRELPALVPRREPFVEGQLVLLIDTPRRTWRNHLFAGHVVDPAEFDLTPAEGDEYPTISLEDLFI